MRNSDLLALERAQRSHEKQQEMEIPKPVSKPRAYGRGNYLRRMKKQKGISWRHNG